MNTTQTNKHTCSHPLAPAQAVFEAAMRDKYQELTTILPLLATGHALQAPVTPPPPTGFALQAPAFTDAASEISWHQVDPHFTSVQYLPPVAHVDTGGDRCVVDAQGGGDVVGGRDDLQLDSAPLERPTEAHLTVSRRFHLFLFLPRKGVEDCGWNGLC